MKVQILGLRLAVLKYLGGSVMRVKWFVLFLPLLFSVSCAGYEPSVAPVRTQASITETPVTPTPSSTTTPAPTIQPATPTESVTAAPSTTLEDVFPPDLHLYPDPKNVRVQFSDFFYFAQ